MKKYLVPFLLLVSFTAQPQTITNPDLQAMVDTERAFVQMAKEQNTRDAFLFYMTDDVVGSGPKGITIGKEPIKKQKVGNAWLFWDVAFSDISASGDFGYNTGPWEFRSSKSLEVKPTAFGEFNSIWKKQPDGSWKNALDIGTSHAEGPRVQSIKLEISAKPLTKKKAEKNSQKDELLELEKKFIELSTADAKSAYYKYLSNESRIVHSGRLPITTPEEKQKFLSDAESLSKVELVSGDIASSNDLGYVYGKADVQITKDGNAERKLATYFRVWKKEDGKTWKIVLDVLSY